MNGFHHLDEATIVSYASGTLSEGLLPIVANHVTHCAKCGKSVRRAEAIGGAMLEVVPPEQLSAGTLDTIIVRIELGNRSSQRQLP
jgi:putative transcriptional regulator